MDGAISEHKNTIKPELSTLSMLYSYNKSPEGPSDQMRQYLVCVFWGFFFCETIFCLGFFFCKKKKSRNKK